MYKILKDILNYVAIPSIIIVMFEMFVLHKYGDFTTLELIISAITITSIALVLASCTMAALIKILDECKNVSNLRRY
jgi:chromate transport protein ChrA